LGGVLSDASDSESDGAAGAELLDDLKTKNERPITEAKATIAMIIRFCAMVRTRANFRICAGLNDGEFNSNKDVWNTYFTP